MKHIIVPTDLTISSLQPVHDVMHHYQDEPVRITLLHLLQMPVGIGDLLFRSHRPEKEYVSADFKEACEVLCNRYSNSLTALHTRIARGSTVPFLTNLLEGLRTDAVFVPQNARFASPFSESVDILPMLRATGFTIIETARRTPAVNPVDATIGDLLFAGE